MFGEVDIPSIVDTILTISNTLSLSEKACFTASCFTKFPLRE
jgi:hypothetical protein